jgi:citrate lyase subunit beta/citryl-CoA lyase
MGATNGNAPRILRTLGFAPAHKEDYIFEIAALGLDSVGPDLEDLTPRSEKQRARDIFRDVAKRLAADGVTVQARVNVFDNGLEADLDAVVCPELHCVNISKAESGDDVKRFCELLEKAEAKNGVPVGSILVRPVIETANGVRCAYEIAAASPRVTYMGGVAGGFWGDLGGTVGTIAGPDGDESYYIRSKVIIDVRSAGVKFPIGGGGITRKDIESTREFAWKNKRLGYTGQYTSIGYNPRDKAFAKDVVATINEVYTPTMEEITLWKELLPHIEKATADGVVCFDYGDTYYDIAGHQRVLDQLELARRLGLTD